MPETRKRLPIVDQPHAPVIYFEDVPFFGQAGGVYRFTLSTGVTVGTIGNAGEIENRNVVVAHLRGNRLALESLLSSIQQALAAEAKPEGKPN